MKDRVEFDSVITENALNNFKIYHNLHNVGGIFQYVFAVFALVMCGLGIAYKMSTQYILMMGLFGGFFFLYPSISMRVNSKNQMKRVEAFKAPMHYLVTEDKITVSQNGNSEDLSWDQVYKIVFTGKNFVLYLSSVRANVLTLDTMREEAKDFVAISRKKLKPFQVKVNEEKLNSVIAKNR